MDLKKIPGIWLVYSWTLLFLLMLPEQVVAQKMEVTKGDRAPFTPTNLIQDVFLGNGVEILDIQYSGSTGAIGYFEKGDQAIHIDRGIVMTTGAAEKVSGFGRDGAQDNSDPGQLYQNDADLKIIAKDAPIRNVAKYTIRFIPTSDTLRFRYVFASEEYPEFVCSEFNDVFGFFISGPGFNGPFENGAENIALIPGTDLPVAINNVNGGDIGIWGNLINCLPPLGSLDYSSLYNDNQGTMDQPVYDGFTQVFTAEAVVVPCEEYTIKLAIADVTDEGYDSGVFLEAKSFGTSQLLVEARTISPDGAVVEGCATGLITFTLSRPQSTDYVIDYQVFGSAENGRDYEFLPGQIVIPAGKDSVSIVVNALEDSLIEAEETLFLEIQKDICYKDTVFITIKDNELTAPLMDDARVCPGEGVSLDGTLPIFIEEAKEFRNSTPVPIIPAMTAVYSEINVSGVYPLLLRPGVIESVCVSIQHNNPEELDLFLVAPNGRFLLLSSNNGQNGVNYTNTCFTEFALVPIDDPSASAPFQGDFLPEGRWEDLWGELGPVNGTWQLLLYDDEFGSNGIIRDWSIRFNPPYEVFYNWSPAAGLPCSDCPEIFVNPAVTTTYQLQIDDSYGCAVTTDLQVEVLALPPTPTVSCDSISWNTITFQWEQIPGLLGYEVNLNQSGWQAVDTSVLFQTISGLQPGEAVDFGIRPLADCPGRDTTITCVSLNCLPPDLSIQGIDSVQCHGQANGAVHILATGGSSFYEFSLDGVSNFSGEFQNLPAGSYQVTVSDELGCETPFSFTIEQPSALVSNLADLQPVRCFGGSDGVASINSAGGQAPYQINWVDQSDAFVRSDLPAGIFSYTITDAHSCVTEGEVTITQPDALETALNIRQVSCNGAVDGTAAVLPAGGVGPYLYQWDGNAGSGTNDRVTNLAAGTYFVTILDANGCTLVEEIVIPENPAIEVLETVQAVTCFGGRDGRLEVLANGGTDTFTYLWSNGVQGQVNPGLEVGSYQLTVVDSDGCQAVRLLEISQPDSITIVAVTERSSCPDSHDGKASVTVGGGTPAYSVVWPDAMVADFRSDLGPGFYLVEVNDAAGCQNSAGIEINGPDSISMDFIMENPSCHGQSNGRLEVVANGGNGGFQYSWSGTMVASGRILEGIPAGFYQLLVEDARGCRKSEAMVLEEPEALNVEASTSPVICYNERNGKIEVTLSGGTPDYEYIWTGPNGFSGFGKSLDFLPAGRYTLEARDANQCLLQASWDIAQPDPLTALMEVFPVSCANRKDGEIFLAPEGGTPPYTVFLNGNSVPSDHYISNLRSGNYLVEVVDANGCAYDLNDVIVDDAKPLSVDLGPDRQIEWGDTFHLKPNIQHTFPIARYEWTPTDSGILSCTDCAAPIAKPSFQTVITLTVVDEKGCKANDLMTIFVEKDAGIDVPTGFSPNGDGNNDQLVVHGRPGDRVKLFRVFDRWGELVFEAHDFEVNDPASGWDGTYRGKMLNPAVFVWYAEVEFLSGGTGFFKGASTLIR